jgi:hypothetical protein
VFSNEQMPPPTERPVRRRARWVVPVVVATTAMAAGALGAATLLWPSAHPPAAAPVPSASAASAPSPSDSAPSDRGAPASSVTRTYHPPPTKPSVRPPPVPVKVGPMTSLSAAAGAAALRAAGIAPYGEVRQAVRWTDRNGRNLLVATLHIDLATANGTPTAATLRVVHLAHLESRRTTLRVLTDPSGPACEFDFVFDVTDDYFVAGDVDRDGYGDVSVAWSTSCLSEADRSQAKVALLSNGQKYILRGHGWPYGMPDSPGNWPEASIDEVEPGGQWPPGFRRAAENVFIKLYH